MRGGDQLQIEGLDSFENVENLLAVGGDDIGVVALRLFHDLGKIHFVVETDRSRDVLTERVVGEENLFFGHVRDGRFRPVNHRDADESEGTLS